MTFNEIVPLVLELPAHDQLLLIRILAEALTKEDDVFPFEPDSVIELWTPLRMEGVPATLDKLMHTAAADTETE